MTENRSIGTYWRITWSTDWWSRYPWAVEGKLMPYFGRRETHEGRARFWTYGPVLITAVTPGRRA